MAYIQPLNLMEVERESFLRSAKIARFCSHNPDGTIHAATVSYRYLGEEILIITPAASRKARNVRRNRTVTVLVDTTGKSLSDYRGLLVYGTAALRESTLDDMVTVNESWMPTDKVKTWTRRMRELSDWVTVQVAPEGFASWDYGKDEEFAALVGEWGPGQPRPTGSVPRSAAKRILSPGDLSPSNEGLRGG